LPAPTAVWQHAGQSGQFQVRVDLVRGFGRRAALPEITLAYRSGGANDVFGLGWTLNTSAIVRGNSRHLPRYRDTGPESDAFSSTEYGELVPVLKKIGARWLTEPVHEDGLDLLRFRPRVDSAFMRIERCAEPDTGNVYWRTISRDNVTRVYGQTADARVADPTDPHRIAQWLLQDEWDSRGDRIRYEYKREDLAGVPADSLPERHRLASGDREAQLHPKRILWGNARPGIAEDWLFELVFDYGEHDPDAPTSVERQPWQLRPDAFSSYRTGFEIRTRRLCRRVLFFHHNSVGASTQSLIRAHELSYKSTADRSLLVGVTIRGYRHDTGGLLRSDVLPTTRFEYSALLPCGPVREIVCVDGRVAAADAATQQWLDLDSTGLPGLVARGPGGSLHYRPNLGRGILGSPVILTTRPSLTDTTLASVQSLGKPFGDTRSCLVDMSEGPGYQEKATRGDWLPYTPFQEAPTVRTSSAGTRSLDLDGDGRADLMLVGASGPRWHRFEGRDGWISSQEVAVAPSTWKALVDRTGTVLIADMTGDGLADLVQVQSGSVRYWPNLGFGRFGDPVQMAGSPSLDGPDLLDPARVRLFDVNGSGRADLVYLGRETITWYPNSCGNSFGSPIAIADLPAITNLDSIDVVDLLGTGTGCLLWSSAALGRVDRPMRYVELTGGEPPHLLSTITNGQGLETRISYASSTSMMLEDRAAGRPWLTTLPSPVRVVAEVRDTDLVSGAAKVISWWYRHGYYDDVARESRGFAFVERRETEQAPPDPGDPTINISLPIRVTRTWYHTGTYVSRRSLEENLATEFFADDPDHPSRPGLTVEDDIGIQPRQILRSLQGKPIREEVYGLDGQARSACPYSVVDYGYLVRALQPSSGGRDPAVAAFPQETLERTYERVADDPRVAHRLALTIDEFGNVTRSATIAYRRRHPGQPEQNRPVLTIEEHDVVNRTEELTWYRAGVPIASHQYEIGPVPSTAPGEIFSAEHVRNLLADAELIDIPFEEQLPDAGALRRRPIGAAEAFYWNDTLTEAEPTGVVGQLALVHHQRIAAFTPGLLLAAYGEDLIDPAELDRSGYEFDHGVWWARGPRVTYDPDAFHQPAAEMTSLGAESTIAYDDLHLYVARTQDPVGNVQRASYDYQAMAPSAIIDANGATVQVSFDSHGLAVAIAMAGAHGEGDLLSAPTIEVTRDLLAWQRAREPVAIRTSVRTRHDDPARGREQSVSFHGGRGSEIQRKRLAEPETEGGPPRWVIEQHVVTTASGTPLRAYNPGFTSNASFTPEIDIASLPVTRTRLDALGRAAEVRHANGALTRTVITAWSAEHWDPNDTVRDSDWLRERRRADATSDQIAQADAAERHANTPSVERLDVVGRPFLVLEGGSAEGMPATQTKFGAKGEVLAITDRRGIVTERRVYDMLGRVIRVWSAASGETRVLHDVNGDPVHAWGAQGQEQRLHRDRAARPTHREVRSRGAAWRVAERMIWGEQATGSGGYLRGRLHEHYDGAGRIKISAYDFEGNPLRIERSFRSDLTTRADWSILAGVESTADAEMAAAGLISGEILSIDLDYDALGRVVSRTAPDRSVVTTEVGLRGLPSRVAVTIAGSTTRVLDDPTYDAAGRRLSAVLGNGVAEQSTFDTATGRLMGRLTIGPEGDAMRALTLGYDAVGNVLSVFDSAQQTLYFRNAVVLPHRSFTYDALYRLVSAEGREAATPTPSLASRSESLRRRIPHPNDLTAVRRYTENYSYDRSGNLLRVEHVAADDGSWTASYDIAPTADRITAIRGRDGSLVSSAFNYDPAGNALRLGGLTGLTWDDDDQLVAVDLEGGGRAFYTYDAAGQRASKVVVRRSGVREERLYLDGYERFRRIGRGGSADREITSLHVEDSTGRVAIVERRRTATASEWITIWRYQHADQVSSCSLETDADGRVLTFEEYRPYGVTAYHAAVPAMLPKRYRFGGQESDQETGLNYHGARYYAPWLCRWISPDPAGMADGTNRYWFARNNPVTLSDRTGFQSASEQFRYERVGVWGTTGGQPVHWMIRIPVQGVAREITAADIDTPPAPTPTPPTSSHTSPPHPHRHRHPTRPRRPAPVAPPAPTATPAPDSAPAAVATQTAPPVTQPLQPGQTASTTSPTQPPASGVTPANQAGNHLDAGRVAEGVIGAVARGGLGIAAVGLGIAFPPLGVVLTVAGLLALAYGAGRALATRQNDADRSSQPVSTGIVVAAAVADTVGVSGLWEGNSGYNVVSGERLTREEQSQRLAEGLEGGIQLAVGAATWRAGIRAREATQETQRANLAIAEEAEALGLLSEHSTVALPPSSHPPEDPYDSVAWNAYYAENPNAPRSVGAAAVDDPAFGSAPLRLHSLNPEFVPSITREQAWQGAVSTVFERLRLNPQLAGPYISEAELAAVVHNPHFRSRMLFGRVIERALAHNLNGRGLVTGTGARAIAGERIDFRGVAGGPWSDFVGEVTTLRGWESHFQRSYGTRVTYGLYPGMPVSFSDLLLTAFH
jgi:RHS repeat-associated protein